jgi:hypothetical protein
MVSPVEFRVDVETKIPDWFFGDVHMLQSVYRVNIVYAVNRLSRFLWVGAAVGESHEFTLLGIS